MIVSVGFSYYQVINRVQSSSNDIIASASTFDRDAADESLKILRVRLDTVNSLNLTVKNTGQVLSHLLWIGVFDDTQNTKNYYKVNTSLNTYETQTNIGNSSITINPLNQYTIQIITKLGNIYHSEYPEVDDQNSGSQYYTGYTEVDNHPARPMGTESFFDGMKGQPDDILNNFTEALGGPYNNITLISDESFESAWPPTNWTETGNWNQESDEVYSGSYSADFDGQASKPSGNLTSPEFNCSDAVNIYIEFWYFEDRLVAGDFLLQFWDGSGWDTITDIGAATVENQWVYYIVGVNDTQYFVEDFKVRWFANQFKNNRHGYVENVSIDKEIIDTPRYRLDFEVEWTNLPQTSNEFLSIYAGRQGGENLQIDVWNGLSYVSIISDLQQGWNNVNVSSYHTEDIFNIRFIDTNQTIDTFQDSWEIDALYLNLWD
jgi:hypothetical protein